MYNHSLPQAELKSKQKELLGQLQSQLSASLGPPLRSCLAQAFVTLYEVGDSYSLHETVSRCCDVVRVKEDSGSSLSVNKL